MRATSLILCLFPLPVLACPQGEALLSCPIGKKQLEICLTDEGVTYSFGLQGAPELTLTSPILDAAYTPWPGVGSAIWDSLAFVNNEITYEVWTSVERNPESSRDYQGGVNVLRGETLLAQLSCKDGTVDGELYAIYEAKEAAGQCWNLGNQMWQLSPCP